MDATGIDIQGANSPPPRNAIASFGKPSSREMSHVTRRPCADWRSWVFRFWSARNARPEYRRRCWADCDSGTVSSGSPALPEPGSAQLLFEPLDDPVDPLALRELVKVAPVGPHQAHVVGDDVADLPAPVDLMHHILDGHAALAAVLLDLNPGDDLVDAAAALEVVDDRQRLAVGLADHLQVVGADQPGQQRLELGAAVGADLGVVVRAAE